MTLSSAILHFHASVNWSTGGVACVITQRVSVMVHDIIDIAMGESSMTGC